MTTPDRDPLITQLRIERNAALAEARRLAATGMASATDGVAFESSLMDAERAESRLSLFSRASVGAEPMTYRPDSRHSYFADLVTRELGRVGSTEAEQRLRRHEREVAVEMQRITQARESEWRAGVSREGLSEVRAVSAAAGSGGGFAPPVYLLQEYASVPRSGRTLADKVRSLPMPDGAIQSVRIPRITGIGGVASQVAQNTALPDVGAGFASQYIEAPVVTMAGNVTVSLQLLEEAGPAFDVLMFADLTAAYDAAVEAQVMAGSGTNGEVLGLLNTPGGATVTADLADPVHVLGAMGQAFSLAATARKRIPTAWFLAPRRIAWLNSQSDSSAGPFSVQGAGKFADLAVLEAEDGPFGPFAGLPGYASATVPLTAGTGANEDVAVVTRPSDHLLLEGLPQTSVNRAAGATTLSADLRLYQYVAFTAARYPQGTATVTGSGMAAPAGY